MFNRIFRFIRLSKSRVKVIGLSILKRIFFFSEIFLWTLFLETEDKSNYTSILNKQAFQEKANVSISSSEPKKLGVNGNFI